MKEEQIYQAAGEYMEAAARQFKTEADLLLFVTAIAGLSLSVMESLGGEDHLKQFVSDATSPNRIRTEVVLETAQ